jgi:hypothetical protein
MPGTWPSGGRSPWANGEGTGKGETRGTTPECSARNSELSGSPQLHAQYLSTNGWRRCSQSIMILACCLECELLYCERDNWRCSQQSHAVALSALLCDQPGCTGVVARRSACRRDSAGGLHACMLAILSRNLPSRELCH